jgi:hypothetical protein
LAELREAFGEGFEAGLGEVGRHLFGFERGEILLLVDREGAVALHPAAEGVEGLDPLFSRFGPASAFCELVEVAGRGSPRGCSCRPRRWRRSA